MYRTGIVSDQDHAKGMVRATLPDEGDVKTPWLHALARDVKGSADHGLPSIGAQVAILLDDEGASGCVLGAIYSDDVNPVPSAAAEKVRGIVFSDGCEIQYDADSHILNVTLPSGGEVRVGGMKKLAIAEDVESELSAMRDDLLNHQHLPGMLIAPPGMAGGPVTGMSGAPVSIAYSVGVVGAEKVKGA